MTIMALIGTIMKGLPGFMKILASNCFLRTPLVYTRGILGYFIMCGVMCCPLTLSIIYAGSVFTAVGITAFNGDFGGAPTGNIEHWIVDSGATFNLGCQKDNFTYLNTAAPKKRFRVASTGPLESQGIGTVELPMWNSTTNCYDNIKLDNVYYCP